ncbi:MAG: hypothetical protein WDN72_00245 [Alphaproteobacteria bacterium]
MTDPNLPAPLSTPRDVAGDERRNHIEIASRLAATGRYEHPTPAQLTEQVKTWMSYKMEWSEGQAYETAIKDLGDLHYRNRHLPGDRQLPEEAFDNAKKEIVRIHALEMWRRPEAPASHARRAGRAFFRAAARPHLGPLARFFLGLRRCGPRPYPCS